MNISDWSARIQRRRAMLLSNLLLTIVVVGVVAMVSVYVSLPEGLSPLQQWWHMAPFIVGWLIVLLIWAWRDLSHRLRALPILLLAYFLGCVVFWRGGLPGSGRVWLLLLPALGFILVGPRTGVAAGILSILTYAFFTLAISQRWAVPQVAEDLTTLSPLIGEGGTFLLVIAIMTLILWSFNQSWWNAMGRAGAVNQQLQARTQELEETAELLHRQASQLQATAEIARVCSSTLDLELLLVEVVNQIQEGFRPMGVYYVGLFLLDGTGQSAVLKAATGEAGQLLLEMGYKVELDETSTVGWCIVNRETRIAPDVKEGTVQYDVLPMPHTRSEIGLPLRSRGRALGALSVHSTQETAFSEADTAVLQAMADQVMAAIDNARLFSQTESALREVQAAHKRYLAQSWGDFLAARPVTQVDYYHPGAEPEDGGFLRQARRAAMVHGRAVATDSPSLSAGGEPSLSQTALVVPLKLRGQIIGTLALHETRHQRPWTARDITLAETVAEQVALTVENLRLMDETRRSAARERLVGEISDRMQQASDMETLMRIAAEELNRALSGSRAFVRLGTAAELAGGDGSGHESQEERS